MSQLFLDAHMHTQILSGKYDITITSLCQNNSIESSILFRDWSKKSEKQSLQTLHGFELASFD